MDYSKLYKEFKELLGKYKRVTIISHIRPDGDTITSALALYNALKSEGVVSELVCANKPPKKFAFIDGFSRFKSKIDYSDSLVITLDCADLSRVGFNLDNRVIVNIDHHKSSTLFGTLNIVEVEVSTTVVLYKLLKKSKEINSLIATALYAGLLSDSQNFTISLTSKDTFTIASELLSYGVDLLEVSNRVNKYNSLAHIRVLGKAIDSLRLYSSAKVAVMVITREDIEASGATFSDIDGIIDYAISLATVEVAVLITDFLGLLKVSLRSKNVDVSKVAVSFGGGGHKMAAGFEVKDAKIEQVKQDILKELKGI